MIFPATVDYNRMWGVGVLVYILFSVGRGRAVGVRIVEINIIM